MQVFFSWSGESSRLAAVALSTCVSEVIQAVEPWLSEAIAKGAQWRDQLNTGLEKSTIGVCCLTRENMKAEWILFEAGAISKTKDAHLCTFLLDLKPADVSGPLAGFQHTIPEKGDVKKLLQMINAAVLRIGEKGITESQLEKFFERAWPDLQAALAEARKAAPRSKRAERTERELLEEILEHVRRAAQPPPNGDLPSGATLRDKLRSLQRELVTPGAAEAGILTAAVNVIRAAGLQVTRDAVWGETVWSGVPAHVDPIADVAFVPSSGSLSQVAFAPDAFKDGPSGVPAVALAFKTVKDLQRQQEQPKGKRRPEKR